jgi:hypothetical protein
MSYGTRLSGVCCWKSIRIGLTATIAKRYLVSNLDYKVGSCEMFLETWKEGLIVTSSSLYGWKVFWEKFQKWNICPQTVSIRMPMLPFESLSQELHNMYNVQGILINFQNFHHFSNDVASIFLIDQLQILITGTSSYWGYITVSSEEVSTMALAISLFSHYGDQVRPPSLKG